MQYKSLLFLATSFFIQGTSHAWTVTDLGTLGGDSSHAKQINDRGYITGVAKTSQGNDHAFLWNGSTMQDLGTLGGNISEGEGINIQNHVIGTSDLADGSQHAFFWNGSQMIDLGTLGGQNSAAYGINDFDQIVGQSETSSGERHAFIWENGNMVDLGTLGGAWSTAISINNLSQVIGTSCLSSNCGMNDTVSFFYEKGQMLNMDTLGGPNDSFGLGINSTGAAIVGKNNGDKYEIGIYKNGSFQNLKGIPDASSFYVGLHAINNNGEIVGHYPSGSNFLESFYYDGNFHTFNFPQFSDTFFLSVNNAKMIVGGANYAGNGLQHAILVKP